jgi:hypothetical protein
MHVRTHPGADPPDGETPPCSPFSAIAYSSASVHKGSIAKKVAAPTSPIRAIRWSVRWASHFLEPP